MNTAPPRGCRICYSDCVKIEIKKRKEVSTYFKLAEERMQSQNPGMDMFFLQQGTDCWALHYMPYRDFRGQIAAQVAGGQLMFSHVSNS